MNAIQSLRSGTARLISENPITVTIHRIEYKDDGAGGQVKVESKDDMKKRGLSSPDRADAVVLAFAADTRGRVLPDNIKNLFRGVSMHG